MELEGRTIKRPRLEQNNKAASAMEKFRGVLPQQNGNWGAQIYTNHQRIWLGTFRTEKDAAMAYDSASMKLRKGDYHSQRNFPWTQRNFHELLFQSAFTAEETLDMIRDATYRSKFDNFLKNQSKNDNVAPSKRFCSNGENMMSCRQLFQKELTPSDVGKLNRLVIPKKYAVRYFPCINNEDFGDNEDTELVFFDRVMKTWMFRYCYWKSSQSFVFTRGWNKFVKEKELRANDVVTFYTCDGGGDHDQSFCLIDVNYTASEGNVGIENNEEIAGEEGKVELKLNVGAASITCSLGNRDDEGEKVVEEEELKEEDHCGVRLFGVQIN